MRGGHDQFKWDNVKLMSYKDRECYLGASSKVGFLDKGGKWRRRDWYTQQSQLTAAELKHQQQQKIDELKQLKKEEQALMNFKLGVTDDYNRGCTDIKQVLANIRQEG